MATENISVSVQSQELEALIAQLRENQTQLAAMEQAAEEAARAMDNLGDKAAQAGDSVDKASDGANTFSISGAKAAVAGAAMGAAMVAVEKAMELATAAIGAINEATVAYIRTTQAGQRSLDAYTGALERSKQQIAIAIADTGRYQEVSEEAAVQIERLSQGMTDLIVISDNLAVVTESTVGSATEQQVVLQRTAEDIPFLTSTIEALSRGLDSLGSYLQNSSDEIRAVNDGMRKQVPVIEEASSAWDVYIGRLNDAIDSTVNLGNEFRATAAVSNLAGGLVGWFNDIGEGERRTSAASSSAAAEQERIAREAIQTATSLGVEFSRIFEGNGLKLSSFMVSKFKSMTEEQRRTYIKELQDLDRNLEAQYLLRVEAAEDDLKLRQEQQRILDEHLASQANQTRIRMALEEAERAEELAAWQEFNQTRMNLLFGGGEFEDLSKRMKKFLLGLSENGAASLGVLNSAMKDLTTGFASSFSSALASGENVGKALKETLGDMLSSLGQSYAVMGAGLLIPKPFNPLGNPAAGGVMIGVGAGMMGLARAFGAGGDASPSVATPRASGSSQTTYSNVSIGFAGDRRATAREVAEVQRDAMRRGL